MKIQYIPLPNLNYQYLNRYEYFMLLESSLCNRDNYLSYLFFQPREIIKTSTYAEIPDVFAKIERLSKRFYLVGYFTYELGYYLQPKFNRIPPQNNVPLIHLAVYDKPLIYDHRDGKFSGSLPRDLFKEVYRKPDSLSSKIKLFHPHPFPPFGGINSGRARPNVPFGTGEDLGEGGREFHQITNPQNRQNMSKGDLDVPQYNLNRLDFNWHRNEYYRKIERIKKYIRQGDTYQVNFTGNYKFTFSGSPYTFYLDLKSRQNVPYSAFFKCRDEYVLSLSPELFFRRIGTRTMSQPMKGTISRGNNIDEDKVMMDRLANSEKERAENLMIVDLVRNDFGRICQPGSVKVNDLFAIEKYDTLFQMTSTVTGNLRAGVSYFDIFRTMFPGGSVTGAPKIRTMQIIREIEKTNRGIYCGALGFIGPDNKAVLNLPIRTVHINKSKGQMGVGSGIVYDSVAEKEYTECMVKAKFLTQRYNSFALIETLLWDKKYFFLPDHLTRIVRSAEYFRYRYVKQGIAERLIRTSRDFVPGNEYKVRLLLNKSGDLEIQPTVIEPDLTTTWSPPNLGGDDEGVRQNYITFSQIRTDTEDIFLYHKTTNRKLYDAEFNKFRKTGFYDVIFCNNREEVTEGSFNNLFIYINGKCYTPPVRCGLLPGIYRNYYIRKFKVKEKVIYQEEIQRAERIYLTNSVRGIVLVRFK